MKLLDSLDTQISIEEVIVRNNEDNSKTQHEDGLSHQVHELYARSTYKIGHQTVFNGQLGGH